MKPDNTPPHDKLQDKLLLTVREAAQALSCSERLIWQMKYDGSLPHVVIGRRSVRFSAAELREWICARSSQAPKAPHLVDEPFSRNSSENKAVQGVHERPPMAQFQPPQPPAQPENTRHRPTW